MVELPHHGFLANFLMIGHFLLGGVLCQLGYCIFAQLLINW